MTNYEALLLDLDGTLVPDDYTIRPAVAAAVGTLVERGVAVMIATGRSESGTDFIVRDLGLKLPAVVYNGAAIWDPATDELIEERVLSNRTVERTLDFAAEHECVAICMQRGVKFANTPRDEIEERSLLGMENLTLVDFAELPRENLIRITLQTRNFADSGDLCRRLDTKLDAPTYLTDFPLRLLARHRDSPVDVVDVQPPCRGKGEALRWLYEERGITAERVVAVGDSSNDIPMLERAGLGVAMAEASAGAAEVADRQIGSCNSDAIAELIAELF